MRELNLAIQATRAEQRGVQDVRPVRRRDDLHPVVAREPVQLIQQLEHGALHLAVAVGVRVEPLGADRVDLVDEDDRGRLLLGQSEGVAHEFSAVADEHLHEERTRELQVRGVGLRRAGARDERLAGAGRAVKQDTLGRANAQRLELLRVGHGQDHRLGELLDLLVEAANVGVILCGLLVNLHGLDAAVVLRGEHVEDEIRVLIDAYQIRGLQLVSVDETDDGQEDGLPRRGLEHHGLALTFAVQIYVRAVVLLLVLGLEVQDLHHVPHQVRELLVHLDLLEVLLHLLLVALQIERQPVALIPQHPDLVLQQSLAHLDVLQAGVLELPHHLGLALIEHAV
mmetsp:Transcript_9208/g.35846  ORF Transcript_9208/g.35846 Transcript_9208/m.35846 type:complete len:340 (-) Transcript_9208:62-1081(-)